MTEHNALLGHFHKARASVISILDSASLYSCVFLSLPHHRAGSFGHGFRSPEFQEMTYTYTVPLARVSSGELGGLTSSGLIAYRYPPAARGPKSVTSGEGCEYTDEGGRPWTESRWWWYEFDVDGGSVWERMGGSKVGAGWS